MLRTSPLLDPLFPRIRQALLGVFLLNASEEWYLSSLAQALSTQPSSLQREIASMLRSAIIVGRKRGNRTYYRINERHPFYQELHSIFVKTIGAIPTLTAEIEPFFTEIAFAFVFGSYADDAQGSSSDIDLMIVGDVDSLLLSQALRRAERKTNTEIDVSLYSMDEFLARSRGGNHFVVTVLKGSKWFIKGTQNELDTALAGAADQAALDIQARA